MNENGIFEPLKDWEGIYEINRNGNIRSIDRYTINSKGIKAFIKGKLLNQRILFGYSIVHLSSPSRGGRNYRVHRLLAIQYIPNPNNYPVINHKNSIRHDNRLENIEWCTWQYNNWHTYSNGRLMHNRVLSYEDVHFIYHNTMVPRKPYNRPGKYTMNEMCEMFNVTKRTIIKILKKLSYLEMVNTFEDISWYGDNNLKQA